jgi:hypothetical protein
MDLLAHAREQAERSSPAVPAAAPIAARTEPATPARTDESEGASSGPPRIRCPKCGWTPRAEDRWQCHCRHIWNTFDTGGVCPGCMYQWKETQCLRCGQMSPHSDWYRHRES